MRTQDHAPLFEAAKCGHVLPLYIIEPEYWQEPDTSKRQWEFIEECLSELDEDLQSLGAQLVTKVGNVVEIFQNLSQDYDIKTIFSHEETGNGWTFRRDIAVKNWCRAQSIPWKEFQYQQFGIERLLALAHLESFLEERGQNYRREMSSLSPALACLRTLPMAVFPCAK